MAVISGKYKVVIIWHLGHEGPLRYGEIYKLFPGISDRILTKQLRELEQDGIVGREVFPVVPPKVEYHLTELGSTLLPIVDEIWRWGKENMKYYHEKLMEMDKET
ncbi:MAG: winged helix-turn-helix transcriptional regulator [Treponema sp.]|nr:winged helix-turn-helix transcriptional regulator [Treponema sp.]